VALVDVCTGGNPRPATVEDLDALYQLIHDRAVLSSTVTSEGKSTVVKCVGRWRLGGLAGAATLAAAVFFAPGAAMADGPAVVEVSPVTYKAADVDRRTLDQVSVPVFVSGAVGPLTWDAQIEVVEAADFHSVRDVPYDRSFVKTPLVNGWNTVPLIDTFRLYNLGAHRVTITATDTVTGLKASGSSEISITGKGTVEVLGVHGRVAKGAKALVWGQVGETQAGAKVEVYYRAKGASGYKLIGSTKALPNSYFRLRSTKLGVGSIYARVAKSRFATAAKSPVFKATVKEYAKEAPDIKSYVY